jgi:membrane protein implicated in regulation of membrane protease activity
MIAGLRAGGELWQARCEPPAEEGDDVRVEAIGPDLVLTVRPVLPGT